MLSFSGFVFSWRMRLRSMKKHRFAVNFGIVIVLAILVCGPPIYRESWLDPFSTLNVPNRQLHPHAINKLGLITSEKPFLPLYFANEAIIRELMRNLQRSTPLSSSDQTLLSLENQKILYFTLHREPSRYHVEEDYALQYYPENGIIRFGQQFFRLNEASIYTFSQITNGMTSGWWK